MGAFLPNPNSSYSEDIPLTVDPLTDPPRMTGRRISLRTRLLQEDVVAQNRLQPQSSRFGSVVGGN